jgi:formate hydrogenlyase transcriptional activator
VLRGCGGRVSGRGGAAEIIGVPPTTLYSRLKRLRINANDYRHRLS